MFGINYFKVSKFGIVTYIDIMPTKEEFHTEGARLTEFWRYSKSELEGATAELGEVTEEKAILSDGFKKEILAGKHKEFLEARKEIDTVILDDKVIFQKSKYIPCFDGVEDNIKYWIIQVKYLVSVEEAERDKSLSF